MGQQATGAASSRAQNTVKAQHSTETQDRTKEEGMEVTAACGHKAVFLEPLTRTEAERIATWEYWHYQACQQEARQTEQTEIQDHKGDAGS